MRGQDSSLNIYLIIAPDFSKSLSWGFFPFLLFGVVVFVILHCLGVCGGLYDNTYKSNIMMEES